MRCTNTKQMGSSATLLSSSCDNTRKVEQGTKKFQKISSIIIEQNSITLAKFDSHHAMIAAF